jgi:hypothetical protein
VILEELASKEPSQATAKMMLTTTRMGFLTATMPAAQVHPCAPPKLTVVRAVSVEMRAQAAQVA